MRSEMILNFRWHVPGLLATGSKPSTVELVEALKEAGFKAILSLEAVGESVTGHIRYSDIDHLLLPVEDDSEVRFDASLVGEGFWRSFCEFLDVKLAKGVPVFVHCSAGICRSVRLVERYAKERLSA